MSQTKHVHLQFHRSYFKCTVARKVHMLLCDIRGDKDEGYVLDYICRICSVVAQVQAER